MKLKKVFLMLVLILSQGFFLSKAICQEKEGTAHSCDSMKDSAVKAGAEALDAAKDAQCIGNSFSRDRDSGCGRDSSPGDHARDFADHAGRAMEAIGDALSSARDCAREVKEQTFGHYEATPSIQPEKSTPCFDPYSDPAVEESSAESLKKLKEKAQGTHQVSKP